MRRLNWEENRKLQNINIVPLASKLDKIQEGVTVIIQYIFKLGLSCAKLRLNWDSMLRLPLNKICILKVENYFELYRTVTKQVLSDCYLLKVVLYLGCLP